MVFVNPLHRSWPERLGIGALIVCLAYIVAVKLQKASTSAVSPAVTSTAPTTAPITPSVTAPITSPPAQKNEGTSQPAPDKQTAGAPELASLGVNGASAEAAPLPDPRKSCRAPCAEVLYEGPTAAGGVINPRDIMAKELGDAGFDVILGGPMVSPGSPRASTPPPQTAPPSPSVPPDTVTPQAPSGLTVKEIFDFVRKSQEGDWMRAPSTWAAALSFSTLVYAASPSSPRLVVVAMRASMQHLNDRQGIFSTEANMQIAAVNSDGKRIQSVVMMAGPETVRGFGLDWDRAEETALKDISAKMCPQFAKDLQQKVAGEK
jgi:hypothetical protein